ncbi:MAG: bifunctional folylpolyglutamate synthase/dihydrofolate synthase [Planctomycetes bacterium]|nr:bifunctional folylpolyglutamate synthase/dihydrofolate synthase [Planctomycetota bacterium]
MAPSAYDRAFRRLASLTDYETMATVPYHERTYRLARMDGLLDDLGRPFEGKPLLQVVGSKGKGTTTEAAASILRAGGLRTGAYTSPHLVHPSERITVDGRPPGGGRFAAAVDRVLPLALARAEGDRATFFELMTAVALLLFEEEGCEAAVLEAGMGGRLDSTTAPRRTAVLLTSISLDHVKQLGRTTALIAAEKAGAARRGVPFFSAVPPGSPAGRVVAERCRRVGAPLWTVERDWRVLDARTGLGEDGPWTSFDLALGKGPGVCRGFRIPMLGVHQAGNAALAAAAILLLSTRGGPDLPTASLWEGLQRTRVPGRLEVVGRRPLLILDGAHNGASVRAAVAAVRAVADPGGRLLVVFGANRDKDLRGMLRAFRGRARLYATEVANPRRAAARDILRLARAEGLAATAAGTPAEALAAARAAAGPRDVVLVTGSMYLAGALRGA